jgi:hypothetical protein
VNLTLDNPVTPTLVCVSKLRGSLPLLSPQEVKRRVHEEEQVASSSCFLKHQFHPTLTHPYVTSTFAAAFVIYLQSIFDCFFRKLVYAPADLVDIRSSDGIYHSSCNIMNKAERNRRFA